MGSAGSRQVTLAVDDILVADRSQDDRRGIGSAEKIDRRVDVADVDESTVAYSHALEGPAIRELRHTIVSSSHDEVVCRRTQSGFCVIIKLRYIQYLTDIIRYC